MYDYKLNFESQTNIQEIVYQLSEIKLNKPTTHNDKLLSLSNAIAFSKFIDFEGYKKQAEIQNELLNKLNIDIEGKSLREVMDEIFETYNELNNKEIYRQENPYRDFVNNKNGNKRNKWWR